MNHKFIKLISFTSIAICILLTSSILNNKFSTLQRKLFKTYLSKVGFKSTNYQDIEYSLKGLTIINFEGVGRLNIKVPEIVLEFGLDLSRNYWIYIKEIHLNQPYVSIRKKYTSSKSETSTNSVRKIPKSKIKKLLDLETTISLHQGKLEILEEKGYSIKALGDVELSSKKGFIEFTLSQISYQRFSLLKNVKGRIILDSNGKYYPFLVSNEQDSNQNWQAKGRVHKEFESLQIFLKNSGLPPEWRNVLDPWIPNPEKLNYAMTLKLSFQDQLEFKYYAASTNFSFLHKKISPNVVGPLPFKLKALGTLNLAKGSFSIREGKLKLFSRDHKGKNVHLGFSAHAEDLLDPSRPVQVGFSGINQSCENSLRVIPEGFSDIPAQFQGQGHYTFRFGVRLEPDKLSQFKIETKFIQGNCKFSSKSDLFSENFLRLRKFPISLENRILTPQQFKFFATDFTTNYPGFLQLAFMANEDQSFWKHSGVLYPSLIEAIRINLDEGYFKYGASTITMQTVKNLYFNLDKTISRKLSEIFLSHVIEDNLSKQEIMDIYANIIEYGPDIFGITDASKVFFNKFPENLSIRESAYLASILPSPRRNYINYCQGRLNQESREKVEETLLRMHSSGWINTQNLMSARSQTIRFSQNEEFLKENCPLIISKSDGKIDQVTF